MVSRCFMYLCFTLYSSDFSSLHLNTESLNLVLLTASEQTRYFSLMYLNISRLMWTNQSTSRTADAERQDKDAKDVRRRKQTEREAGMWRKGVLVSRICREFLIFSLCCCSGRFTNPTCVYLTSWEWDSTINCLCGAFRNSWDKSYWFYL